MMNGVALLNLQIMAPANMKDRSKQGQNNGDRWGKCSLGRQLQPLEIFNVTAPFFHMLTFIALTKRISKVLSGYVMTAYFRLAHFPL